jgi:GNAT superfamily N-acetyltransferase
MPRHTITSTDKYRMRFSEISNEQFTATFESSELVSEQSAPLTREELDAFAEDVKERLGLHHFSLSLTRTGDIKLGMIWVRENQGSGIGTKAMQELCGFADRHGARILLTPNAKDEMFGTTSYARLVRFYKRFGFVENRGRARDFSVSEAMIREPRGKLTEEDSSVAQADEWDKNLPPAGPVVAGLRVRDKIDNIGSIAASFDDYFTLKGVREVPFSLFVGPDPMTHRIRDLMDQIEESGEITPLIVAIDSHNGPYILEGAHRYDALQHMGKETFPALVVFDNDDGYFGDEELNEERLDELSIPPDLKDAGEVLKRAGYEQQMANEAPGAFGSVWRKPGAPYVLKIFSSSDYAYEAFLKLAMAHQDNPHFPKIFGKMLKVTPKYNAVRIEPLTPYKYDSTLIRRYTRYRNYMQNNDVDPNSIVAMEYEDSLEFLYEYPKLKEALDLIIDGLLDVYGNDISNKNIMMRDKTIVITDPVAGTA